jgi:hypothetical protein
MVGWASLAPGDRGYRRNDASSLSDLARIAAAILGLVGAARGGCRVLPLSSRAHALHRGSSTTVLCVAAGRELCHDRAFRICGISLLLVMPTQ